MKIEWGNAPQWVSAVCALALAGLAIYGLFFSTTSQVLVAYLQSELAVRNQHITALEAREQELRKSIIGAEANLGSLTQKRKSLEDQVSGLTTEQEKLTNETNALRQTLSTTTFLLVREKISAKKNSSLSELMVLRLRFGSEINKDFGIPAQQVRPWESFLKHVALIVVELPESDKPLARSVVERFISDCASSNQSVIQIPPLIVRDSDLLLNNFRSEKIQANITLKELDRQIELAEKKINECFETIKP